MRPLANRTGKPAAEHRHWKSLQHSAELSRTLPLGYTFLTDSRAERDHGLFPWHSGFWSN